jgi:hypothetical protein
MVCPPSKAIGQRRLNLERTSLSARCSNFGIKQHMGFDHPEDKSAGCLVGRSKEEHREFMRVVKADPRRKASQGYKYVTTIIDGRDLSAMA